MTEFEVLIIPISLILGLGVTTILTGFINALRARRKAPMHWLPLAWALSILLVTVNYFNVLFDLDGSGEAWTWMRYGHVLVQTMLFFLSAGLVLSHESTSERAGMLSDFENHGRLALFPLGILLGLAPVSNRILEGAPWIGLNNVANVTLTAVIVVTLASKRRALRSVLSAAFLLLMILSVAFAWARPGDSG